LSVSEREDLDEYGLVWVGAVFMMDERAMGAYRVT
jgi:hypothetical protein